MSPDLRNRLIKASAGGVIAIAAAMATFYEPASGAKFYKPYRDTGLVWTVCTGHTGHIDPNRIYTQAECDAFLAADLANAQAGVQRVIETPLNKWQEAALIDFVFNLGEPALASSTMAKLFNAGDIVGGCKQLALWVKGRVRGQLVTLNGLVTRRATEEEICIHGL